MKFRTKLTIWKELPSGVLDSFVVYCTDDIIESVRNKYKSLGYNVA